MGSAKLPQADAALSATSHQLRATVSLEEPCDINIFNQCACCSLSILLRASGPVDRPLVADNMSDKEGMLRSENSRAMR